MDDFPSNSKRQNKERKDEPEKDKKLVKIVEGDVVRRKKSLGKRVREMIVGDEDTTVGEYLLIEVIVPNIKDLIYDVATMGVERRLYGESPRGPRRSGRRSGGGIGHTPYDRISSGGRRDERSRISRQGRARHDFDEIVISNRPDAVILLDSLYDILERYDEVTVSQFYELAGESSNFTDERYGWTDLEGSRIVRARDGWIIDLPRPETLER